MYECDITGTICDRTGGEVLGVFMHRPSDPTEMCAVMWVCGSFAVGYGWTPEPLAAEWDGGVATYTQVQNWIQDFGRFKGVTFVS